MRKKIGIFVDYDQTLADTVSFYLTNLDIFLENLVHSLANFLKYTLKHRKVELMKLIYYFLLEEDKRSKQILERMRRKPNLYVDKNLFEFIRKLSKNENYDVKIVSSSSQNIIKYVLEELEKKFGEKFSIDIIASSQNSLITAKTKEEVARNYNGLKICFVDGPNDVYMSINCNIPIVVCSPIYYFCKEKPRGYKVRRGKLKEVLKLLEDKLTSTDFYQ